MATEEAVVAVAAAVAAGEIKVEVILFAVAALQCAVLLLLRGMGFRQLSREGLKLFPLVGCLGIGYFYLLKYGASSWVPGASPNVAMAELSAVFVAVVFVIVASSAVLVRAVVSGKKERSERRSSLAITFGGTLGFYGVLVLTGIFRAVTTPDIRTLSAASLVQEVVASGPNQRRLEALLVLKERASETVVPAIVAKLEQGNSAEFMQSEALPALLRMLGESQSEAAIPLLRVWLQKELPPFTWTQTAWSLSRLGYREVASDVEARLRSSDAAWFRVTPQLIEILAYLNATESVPTIAVQLEGAAGMKDDVAQEIVQNALLALIVFNTDESKAALQNFVGSDSGRKDAVDAILAQIGKSLAQ